MAENETILFATQNADLAPLAEKLWKNTGLEVIGHTADISFARMSVAHARTLEISTLVAGTDLGEHATVRNMVDVFRRTNPRGLVVPITFEPGEEVSFGNVQPVFIDVGADGIEEGIRRLGGVIREFKRHT